MVLELDVGKEGGGAGCDWLKTHGCAVDIISGKGYTWHSDGYVSKCLVDREEEGLGWKFRPEVEKVSSMAGLSSTPKVIFPGVLCSMRENGR